LAKASIYAYGAPVSEPNQAGPSRAEGETKAYHHGDLRAALVGAARALLEEEGFEALSLRGAARRVQVSRQAPYHHFADRNALLAAVAAEGFRDLSRTMLARMARQDDAMSRMIACGVGYVVFAAGNPALYQLMFSGLGGGFAADPDLLASSTAAFRILNEAIIALHAQNTDHPIDLDLESLTAWSKVHGLADLINKRLLQNPGYLTEEAETLAFAVLTGFWNPADAAAGGGKPPCP
jgi:AcrR family transcriptional regulator